jgi:hypothetical protein
MNPALRDQVRQRARGRCEYCQLPDWLTELPHEADHIRALKHDGPTELANLAWACARCNDYKGSDVSAYLPGTDQLVRLLFHPRIDDWDDHFWWEGALLRGKTDIAQATIVLLKINADRRVSYRRALMEDELFFAEPTER